MVRHCAAVIALAGFSIILKELLTAIPYLHLQPSLLSVFVPLLLFYAAHEWVAYQLRVRTGRSLFYRRLQRGLQGVLGIVTLLLLIGIPLLWWGVIQKLAAMADNGGSGL